MIASSKAMSEAARRWDLIVENFREACLLHKQGKKAASQRILKQELPSLVKAWMQALPFSLREDAKADLRDMFKREQAIVDQGHKLQEIFRQTLIERIIPQIEAKIASKYRSLYLGRQRKTDADTSSWVNPSYGPSRQQAPGNPEDAPLNTGDRRVPLGNVADMIDALRDSEADDMATSLVSLDDIVHNLREKEIDPNLVTV